MTKKAETKTLRNTTGKHGETWENVFRTTWARVKCTSSQQLTDPRDIDAPVGKEERLLLLLRPHRPLSRLLVLVLLLVEGENVSQTVPQLVLRFRLRAVRGLEELRVRVDSAPLVLLGGLGELLVLLCDRILLGFALPEERDDEEGRWEHDQGRNNADVERRGGERDAADSNDALLLVRVFIRLQGRRVEDAIFTDSNARKDFVNKTWNLYVTSRDGITILRHCSRKLYVLSFFF